MKQYQVSQPANKAIFTRNALRTAKINYAVPTRGGIRL